ATPPVPYTGRLLARLGALAGLVATAALPAAPAFAAAPPVSAVDLAFYTAPAIGTSAKGDLLKYRSATVNLGNGAPAVQAWNVLYRSTDSLGAPNVVSGTVIVPATAWSGTGARPIIGYAVGTHGLAQGCAPSLQMARGSDYEAANIAAALKAGYAVLVSDYAGYTTGSSPTYLAGKSQGQAVLDLFRAASLVPGAGLSASAKTAIWGFSQGGQSAAWAGEIKSTYAPGLNLVGIAAGGVPADFINTAGYLDDSTGASFLLGGIIGLATQYPAQIPLDTYTNDAGKAAVAEGKQGCVFDTLFPFMNHAVAEYTVGNKPLNDFFAIPSINQAVTAQNLGAGKPAAPLLQYHGRADEFIPIAQHVALKRKYCSKFANTTFHVYPSEHIVTQFQAAPTVLSWLADRFAGKTTFGTCFTLAAAPTSTANPGGGDFVVSMKSWPLSGVLNLKTLAQSVTLPEGSTFTADANMTTSALNGSMVVPTFTGNVKVVGLPVDVKLKVVEAAPTTGTVSLDTDGLLHIHGTATVNIEVVSAGASILQLPVGCKTSAPVLMPIDYDGPLASLGNGNLVFNGTTTFPPMQDCGLYTSLFTSLMSGPGQTYTISVKPPAPTTW
ncbi:MAG: Triacylglycerol lipase, partial [Moraxellaceae bacterium]|nr:Triacylglycerol lipase [Moraxellaceae bacterium]